MQFDNSIIVLADSPVGKLEELLQELLTEHSDDATEIIVVRESKRGETEDLVTRLQSNLPEGKIRSTYVPDKPQYISFRDVSILLGVKSALSDNLCIISPANQNRRPTLWQRIRMKRITSSVELSKKQYMDDIDFRHTINNTF